MALLFAASTGGALAQHVIPWDHLVCNETFGAAPGSGYFIREDARWLEPEGVFQLTPSEPGKAGRIFIRTPYPLSHFDIRFDAWLGGKAGPGNGSDGIVAVFAPTYDYPVSYGGDLNFTGCAGYGMELDTYHNAEKNDRSPEHMALIYGSTGNHLHSELFATGELEDEEWHSIHITNDEGRFRLYFDEVSRFDYRIENFPLNTGYFGFTSATGTAFNEHKIDNIRITVPSRTATSFGTVSTCLPFTADTVLHIVNNTIDGQALQIDSVAIRRITGPGTFSALRPSLPASLQPNEFIVIPIQFVAAGAGLNAAVLTVFAANGQTVSDTLRITLVEPELRWSAPTVAFPPTHVDGFSEQRLLLTNPGRESVVIKGFSTTWHEFTIESPTAFPHTIHAGDTLEVLLRFSPSTKGGQNALLRIVDFCGSVGDVLLAATAYVHYVDFTFDKNLMLRPAGTGILTVRLTGDQSPIPLHEFSCFLTYDPSIVTFDQLVETNSIIPAAATIELSAVDPGRIHVYVWSETPIVEIGPLFGLRFTDVFGDFACSDITIDTVILNQSSASPGVPFTRGDSSTICINASCRIPEGIHKVLPPEVSAAPNPFTANTNIEVTIHTAAHCRLFLMNEEGREASVLYDGYLAEGSHHFPFTNAMLARGVYFLVLDSGLHRNTTKLIHH